MNLPRTNNSELHGTRLRCVTRGMILALAFIVVRQTTAQDSSPRGAVKETIPVEAVDAMTRSTWLIDGRVTDATTSQPIKEFVVVPGSLSIDDQGKSTVRWRDNLKRQMKNGHLLWPRTSGFSVMRFRVIAEGYAPVVTQRIWRGGPHTRLRVRLRPIQENKAD